MAYYHCPGAKWLYALKTKTKIKTKTKQKQKQKQNKKTLG